MNTGFHVQLLIEIKIKYDFEYGTLHHYKICFSIRFGKTVFVDLKFLTMAHHLKWIGKSGILRKNLHNI